MRETAAPGVQAGLTLVEVLVAVTVMVVAASVALLLYDGARRAFRNGEEAAEQQQGVRSAYERLCSDLRLAGINFNPDGDANEVDEPIEAAFDTALVLRGDLDGDDPSESTDPEAILAGGAQRAVSVGNDEIVAYVLAKPGGSSGDVLRFDADVRDIPRDGIAETVEIPGGVLVQDDPPYTLYRITLNNDVSSWGSGSFFARMPVLENVRSLTFRYLGVGGVLNDRLDLTTASDDIGGADTPEARRRRASIVGIEVEVEALTRDPDPRFEDRRDPNPATRSCRKFRLKRWVAPRNVQKKSLPDPGWSFVMPQGRRRHDANA